ncbi:tRNA (adenine57-N1/adenine58-N1)-methyltransferase catalytic subunit [Geosmithia morbida]|uniref:tRNA (adenine(58)-N(1))-methyltransferase catalytic subunit TRM61 n=1 Tax=Geosmithia morbida TaxID=1094350 RepID=A0A9P4YS78_9HYPO|nr:tRNA (adenine57-N1/adenine58-N1)-methyltransferase catalytic subunit [Geosmithia morbida]KAF4120763.1 tRNA (adenine57-N1/adenine58-N1)-methyltransferase catalytic subunit [Geosmithia morbida]
MAPSKPSSFLEPSLRSTPGDLAIILLARDTYQPITLDQSSGAAVDGYAEGAVLNTRFGSFPHSTFIGAPWGSQVRASIVDTGSRGRKRRRDDDNTPAATPTQTTTTPSQDNVDDEKEAAASTPEPAAKKVVAASSGFVHMLRPTPELWTTSLPHRTQVVYTPDYSYILSRLRARPGTRIIEAGAGSGSFTHASARAVYSGYPSGEETKGKVFSFEFNEARFEKMREEVTGHGLDGIVAVAHRDVYTDGFLADGGDSPNATAVFLDLPAPWKALHHLLRKGQPDAPGFVSPLDPNKTVRICTFSPCIEQVMQTVTELRRLGWTDVDMVEVANKRINVVRDRVGANLPKDKGFLQTPADVMESVQKLRQHNKRTQNFHGKGNGASMDVDDGREDGNSSSSKPWLHGRLVHRPEAEIKTHTSYLVFATLPREWSDDQEAAALAKWPCGEERRTIGSMDKAARRKEKQEMLQPKKQKRDYA